MGVSVPRDAKDNNSNRYFRVLAGCVKESIVVPSGAGVQWTSRPIGTRWADGPTKISFNILKYL